MSNNMRIARLIAGGGEEPVDVTKSEDLGLIPRTYMVDGENQFPLVAL